MKELIQQLHELKAFNEIDLQFAEHILKYEAPIENQETLFLVVLCLSFYANLQHSMLPLDSVNGMKLTEFCQSEEKCNLVIKFPENFDWLKAFPKTIGSEDEYKPLILDQGNLYLNKYHRAEEKVAQFIRQRISVKQDIDQTLAERLNEIFLPKEGDTVYTPDWQKAAAFMALKSHFCVISGGPGTGKTTTVGKILALLLEQNKNLKIDLVAPTGKAADRLGESIRDTKVKIVDRVSSEILQLIPESASTIHRFLGYHGGTKKFNFNTNNLKDTQLLLVDEASMVDLPMFRSLTEALSNDCRVILLGDKDQLTAVETGNVLGDLTAAIKINTFSKEFCEEYQSISKSDFSYQAETSALLNDSVIKLEISHRFNIDSSIGRLAKLINDCDNDTAHNLFTDLFEQQKSKGEIAISAIPTKISFKENQAESHGSLYNQQAQDFFSRYKAQVAKFAENDNADDQKSREQAAKPILEELKSFRLLTASRKGYLGSENLNSLISKERFSKNDQALYHGRCVMIRKNNKALEIYNGDVGVILMNEGVPRVYFNGPNESVRSFSPTILPDFETGFAMTIHKSQGSEYNNILLVLSAPSKQKLSKELIYTGVTRAKKSVSIFVDKEKFPIYCTTRTERHSGLLKRLS